MPTRLSSRPVGRIDRCNFRSFPMKVAASKIIESVSTFATSSKGANALSRSAQDDCESCFRSRHRKWDHELVPRGVQSVTTLVTLATAGMFWESNPAPDAKKQTERKVMNNRNRAVEVRIAWESLTAAMLT